MPASVFAENSFETRQCAGVYGENSQIGKEYTEIRRHGLDIRAFDDIFARNVGCFAFPGRTGHNRQGFLLICSPEMPRKPGIGYHPLAHRPVSGYTEL